MRTTDGSTPTQDLTHQPEFITTIGQNVCDERNRLPFPLYIEAALGHFGNVASKAVILTSKLCKPATVQPAFQKRLGGRLILLPVLEPGPSDVAPLLPLSPGKNEVSIAKKIGKSRVAIFDSMHHTDVQRMIHVVDDLQSLGKQVIQVLRLSKEQESKIPWSLLGKVDVTLVDSGAGEHISGQDRLNTVKQRLRKECNRVLFLDESLPGDDWDGWGLPDCFVQDLSGGRPKQQPTFATAVAGFAFALAKLPQSLPDVAPLNPVVLNSTQNPTRVLMEMLK